MNFKTTIPAFLFLLMSLNLAMAQGENIKVFEKPEPIQWKFLSCQYGSANIYHQNNFPAFFEDSKGNIWSIGNKSLLMFQEEDLNPKIFTKDNSPIKSNVLAIEEDATGVLWVRTTNSLLTFHESKWTNISKKKRIKLKKFAYRHYLVNYSTFNELLKLDEDHNIVVLGSDGYLTFEDNEFHPKQETLKDLGNTDIKQTYNGVYYQWYENKVVVFNLAGVENGNVEIIHNGVLKRSNFNYIHVDQSGKIWLAGFRGIFYYQGGQITDVTEWDQIGSGFTQILEDTNGRIWFASDKGLYLFENDSLKWLYEELGTPGIEQSKSMLKFNFLKYTFLNIFEDKSGNIWVPLTAIVNKETNALVVSVTTCHYQGVLSKFADGVWEPIISSEEMENFSDIQPKSIFQDSSGNLWLDTEKQVVLVKP